MESGAGEGVQNPDRTASVTRDLRGRSRVPDMGRTKDLEMTTVSRHKPSKMSEGTKKRSQTQEFSYQSWDTGTESDRLDVESPRPRRGPHPLGYVTEVRLRPGSAWVSSGPQGWGCRSQRNGEGPVVVGLVHLQEGLPWAASGDLNSLCSAHQARCSDSGLPLPWGRGTFLGYTKLLLRLVIGFGSITWYSKARKQLEISQVLRVYQVP